MPLTVAGAWWAMRHGASVRRAWIVPVATAVTLALSSLVAVKTGEGDEDRAEDVVGQQVIHTHEESAELFLGLTSGLALLTLAGFLNGRVGRSIRGLTAIAALALIIAGYQVGHSGGRIVYGDGATPGISSIGNGPGDATGTDDSAETEDERGD